MNDMRKLQHIFFIMLVFFFPFSILVGSDEGAIPEEPPPSASRIVSLAPSFTEILYALGLGDRVVGVTEYCSYPPEVIEKPKIGGFNNPDIETIVSLGPDLVLGVHAKVFDTIQKKLESLGLRSIRLTVDSVSDVRNSAQEISRMAGVPERGGRLCDEIDAGLKRVQDSVAERVRPKVVFVIGIEPLVIVGKGPYLDELIEIAGGDNVGRDSDAPYLNYSYEQLVVAAPDVIVICGMGSDGRPGIAAETAKVFSKWTSIPAVKNNRLHTVDFRLAATPGPRAAKLAKALALIFHPDLASEAGGDK